MKKPPPIPPSPASSKLSDGEHGFGDPSSSSFSSSSSPLKSNKSSSHKKSRKRKKGKAIKEVELVDYDPGVEWEVGDILGHFLQYLPMGSMISPFSRGQLIQSSRHHVL